jgi:hypothetical protein
VWYFSYFILFKTIKSLVASILLISYLFIHV